MAKEIKEKIKQLLQKPYWLFVIVTIISLLILISIIKLLSSPKNPEDEADKLQNQKLPQISRDVRYTTQETLSTLTGETDNLEKNISEIQKQFEDLKTAEDKGNKDTVQKLRNELENLKKQNQEFKDQMADKIKEHENELEIASSKYDSLKTNNQNENGMVWINDMAEKAGVLGKKTEAPAASLLHADDENNQEPPKPIPAYTIPANTILTGVTAEQPLVGVIPVDGTVVNPQTVQFAVGQKNLAANDWNLPAALKGIQGNAVCEGVFNFQNSAVSCSITSLTFIFQDGVIATETATKEEPFGKLTTIYGNPYIPGTYHGNALYGAMGTGFFSAAQGFGNAFAASQVQTQNSDDAQAITTSFKNANDYAFGQGIGTAGQALNQWWLSLMKSTTNYVYTPNWDDKTHQILQLNAKIEKQVSIDYDPDGRKVNYEQKDNYYNNSLD